VASQYRIEQIRARLSREEGTIIKDWGGRLPIALIYPNSYYIGMSNLGLHAIYKLLNSRHDIVCERAFREKDASSATPILSLETRRRLSEFAVLIFTITYELDYLNIAPIFRGSGIPLYAAERNERHPLIIAGGPGITANPQPLAPFFDCLGIGEAEPILPTMLPVFSDILSVSRSELRQRLSRLAGVYVPQCHSGEPVVRQWTKNLDDFPVASAVLTPDTEFGGMYLIEIERGCNRGCRFCLVGNTFSPMRFRSMDTLINQARQGMKHRQRLGLVGPDVSAHPQLEELVVRLREMGAGISLSSLRVKPLSQVVLRELAATGAQSVTLAPEAGSARLRQVINKGINEDDILEAVSRVAEPGIRQLKCYFMIGLPSETDQDALAIADLAIQCKRILDERHRGMRLSINIAPFVPKAGTPWERMAMAEPAVLNHRLSLLKNRLLARGVSLKWESPAWSEVQAVLSRGGEELAGILADIREDSLAGWRKALTRGGIDSHFYAHQIWDTRETLPWGFIDPGRRQSKKQQKKRESFPSLE
jgi:radical SAM superfamily enzyme YgiQ (UPF0313 family)